QFAIPSGSFRLSQPRRFSGRGRTLTSDNSLFEYCYHLRLRCASGHPCLLVSHVHVYFASHAKPALEINARLDRKARARNQRAFVPGLQIVDVGPIPVNFGVNVMSRPVNEVLAIAGIFDDGAAHVVNLPAEYAAAVVEGFGHISHCGVAAISYDIEYLLYFLRDLAAGKSGPGYVGVDRACLCG